MGDQRGGSQGGTLLVVRANQLDLGSRPVSPSWQSPDIYQPSGPVDVVTVGVPVQLIALVSNFGTTPALGVQVTFWWADSGMGISKAAADPPIGHSPLKTVAAGASVEFECNTMWIPQAVSPGAHPCLVVEAAGSNCPVHYSFRPDLDAQVGQRNLTINPATTISKLKLFNPFEQAARTVIYAANFRVRGRIQEVGMAMLLDAGLPEIRRVLRERGVEIEQAESAPVPRIVDVGQTESHASRPTVDTNGTRAGVPADRIQGAPIGELDLPAGGSATVELELPERSRQTDELVVYQLIQATDGIQVGGYTFVN